MAACHGDVPNPLEPGTESPEDPVPSADHVDPPPPLDPPEYQIPIPESNLEDFGWVRLHDSGIFVEDPTFVLVEVEGGVSVSANPEYLQFYGTMDELPLAGTTVGPFGSDLTGEFSVGVKIGERSLPLSADPGNDLRAFFLGRVSGAVRVQRSGGGPTGGCVSNKSQSCPGGTSSHRAGGYLLDGEQVLKVTPVLPLELHAEPRTVAEGDTVTFTSTAHFEAGNHRWWWVSGDTLPEPLGRGAGREIGCGGGPVCEFAPPESGRMYVRAQIGPNVEIFVAPSERVGVGESFDRCEEGGALRAHASAAADEEECPPDEEEVTIRIVEITTSGSGSSFTTADGENEITMVVQVTPERFAGRIEWEVEVITERGAGVIGPGAVGTGPEVSWTVPAQPRSRWDGYTHSAADAARATGVPFPNSLRFRIKASVADDADNLHQASPKVVEQDERDTIREEYLGFGRAIVPRRSDLGRNSRTNFGPVDLARAADFDTYWARDRLLDGLEGLRREAGRRLGREVSLIVTSGWRNPVHHTDHEGSGDDESLHQYGLAADLRIWDQEGLTRQEFWEVLREVAWTEGIDACYEPADMLRNSDGILTHAHVDWRQRLGNSCPGGWGP